MEKSIKRDDGKNKGNGTGMLFAEGKLPDPQKISALGLAYIGDTVFDLLVRTSLLTKANEPVNRLNKKATALVNAESQSRMVEVLTPHFTDEEAAVYRRGRNAKSATHAKHASIQDYRRATGLEAVFGYLYLSGQYARAEELFTIASTQTSDF